MSFFWGEGVCLFSGKYDGNIFPGANWNNNKNVLIEISKAQFDKLSAFLTA